MHESDRVLRTTCSWQGQTHAGLSTRIPALTVWYSPSASILACRSIRFGAGNPTYSQMMLPDKWRQRWQLPNSGSVRPKGLKTTLRKEDAKSISRCSQDWNSPIPSIKGLVWKGELGEGLKGSTQPGLWFTRGRLHTVTRYARTPAHQTGT